MAAATAVGDTFDFEQITYKVTSETAAEVSEVPYTITENITIP